METFKDNQFILDKAYATANANGYTDEFVKKYVEGFELGYSKACKKGFSDVFAKIYAEGFAEGYAEDFTEGIVFENYVKRILKSGKTPEEIADFCHIDLEKVKEVQKKIQKANNSINK